MSNTLKFANTGPQMSHMIKDHPKETAVPEAVRNMIEAATAYKPDETVELKIRKLDIASGLIGWEEQDGKIVDRFKNKLSFLNPGGMSASELTTAFTKIGSSVGKENSLDRNYGQGIRTSVLYWSELLCITYKNGVAHYVWLGKEELGGNDFQIEIKSADGTDMVQECTDWVVENANQREYNLDEDFTEVILLGKEANPTQDTFIDPYGKNKQESILWLRKAIYTRFWKMPENVKLIFHGSVLAKEGAKKNTGYRDFMTFLDCIDYKLPKVEKKPKGEIVKVQQGPYRGARIHYYHDAPLGENYKKGSKAPYSTFKSNDHGWGGGNISGIILNNEMYDVKSDSTQEQSSLIKLGIHKDHRNFKIMYELPKDAGYTYDMYRTVVLSGQDPIQFDNEDILQDIVDNMPKWFDDLVAETKIKSKVDLTDMIKQRIAAQKSLFNPLAGMTTNGNGGMSGQANSNTPSKPKQSTGKRKPLIPGKKGNKSGEPLIPEIIPNPSVTEPFFAKVEGTRDNPQIFTNPEWKKLETLACQLDIDGDKGRWYLRAKELLENAFTIDAVVWYLNALSENLQGNLSAEEYQDTIAPKSINMFLSTIGSSVFEEVKNQVYREMKSESKEVTKSEEVVEWDD
jgi:hypothetical protein